MSISAANLGGIADPRLIPLCQVLDPESNSFCRSGYEADAIGTTKEHRASISQQVAPPNLHGHRTIYLDNSINFEDYHFWANRSREVEKHMQVGNLGLAGVFNLLIGKKNKVEIPPSSSQSEGSPTPGAINDEKQPVDEKGIKNERTDRWGITETEWEQAQRATRTATWGSIFYLITTDILGPTNVGSPDRCEAVSILT